jgi:hypothetical protein
MIHFFILTFLELTPTGIDKFSMTNNKERHNVSRLRISALFFLLAFFMFPGTGHAYLDPGTGSYFLQLLIAAFVGASFALKLYWRKLKSLYARIRHKEQKESDRETDD